MLLGLISDTHGLVRPGVAPAFAGVDLILHAGDVGGAGVLYELECLARVEAVAGNVDPFALRLPPRFTGEFEGLTVTVVHGHEMGSPTPEGLASRYRADVIVFGHTHRALVQTVGATLVVNPGAAGPRRFRLPPSIALLTLERGRAHAEVVALAP